jgi:DNA-binding transcriptional regulator WhiA
MLSNKIKIINHKNKFNFTKEQKEVLIGVLLGDGHLEQISKVTYRLKIVQSADKEEYVYHLYKIFQAFCSKEPIKIEANGKKSLIFQTKSSISLCFYGRLFYKDKIKIIPNYSLIRR